MALLAARRLCDVERVRVVSGECWGVVVGVVDTCCARLSQKPHRLRPSKAIRSCGPFWGGALVVYKGEPHFFWHWRRNLFEALRMVQAALLLEEGLLPESFLRSLGLHCVFLVCSEM